jgi:acylphosphatase/uncharacterized protein YoxC
MNKDVPGTIRKRYIVKGKVQHVGYRALVRAFAETLGLKGVVRNLQDKTVEIVCEGEPEAIASLLQMINRKGDPMKPMSIIVKSIEDSPPPPAGEFTDFDIDYGRKLTAIEKESFDRDEIMILGAVMLDSDIGGVRTDVQGVGQKVDGLGEKMDSVGQKVDGVGQKVDGLGEKMDSVGQKVDGVGQKVDGLGQKVDCVGTAVRDMHTDMNTRFDHMAERYDLIATSLVKAIEKMDHGFERMDKNAVRMEKAMEQSRREASVSNRELAKAVNFMIKKLSDRPIPRKTSGKKKR